jgi:hypothetical protein
MIEAARASVSYEPEGLIAARNAHCGPALRQPALSSTARRVLELAGS